MLSPLCNPIDAVFVVHDRIQISQHLETLIAMPMMNALQSSANKQYAVLSQSQNCHFSVFLH